MIAVINLVTCDFINCRSKQITKLTALFIEQNIICWQSGVVRLRDCDMIWEGPHLAQWALPTNTHHPPHSCQHWSYRVPPALFHSQSHQSKYREKLHWILLISCLSVLVSYLISYLIWLMLCLAHIPVKFLVIITPVSSHPALLCRTKPTSQISTVQSILLLSEGFQLILITF